MTAAVAFVLVLLAALAGAGLWAWTPDLPRADLEAAYLARPDDLVRVAGTRLHVRDDGPRGGSRGDAPAVILLHGFGSSLHTWEPWARAIAAERRAIRLDLPGSGLSDPDPGGDYTDARSHAVLVALMDRLGVARAVLVGNSIGGRVAWSFATRHPERVAALVLVSPDGFASPGFAYGRAPDVPLAVRAMRVALPRALVRMSLAPAYGDPARLTDATLERYHDLMRAPGVRAAMIRRLEQTVLEDPVPRLAGIRVPVLLVWGEKDAMVPVANAADYARVLPDSTTVTFPGLGHVPQEEAPAESFAPVRAFLDRVAPP